MAISLSAHYGAVVVKLAADGAVLAARGTRTACGTWTGDRPPERFPALPAVVRDTTGAGDAFCAGFLAEWLAAPAGAGLAGPMNAAAQAAAVAVAALGGRPEPGQGPARN